MKYTLKITGDYASSYTEFKGTRREIFQKIREIALNQRQESRQNHNLEQSIHEINELSHQSRLVTMSEKKIIECRIFNLMSLMNSHGVHKFSIFDKEGNMVVAETITGASIHNNGTDSRVNAIFFGGYSTSSLITQSELKSYFNK